MTRLKILNMAVEVMAQGTTEIPGKISTANMPEVVQAPEQQPVDTTPAETNTVLVEGEPENFEEAAEVPEAGNVSLQTAEERLQSASSQLEVLQKVSKTLEGFTPETFTPQDAELLHLAIGSASARLVPAGESFTPESTPTMLRFAKEEIQAAIEALETISAQAKKDMEK